MKTWIALIAALMMLASAGCTKSAPVQTEPKTLRVACCESITFDNQLRDFFEAGFPGWSIDYLPLYNGMPNQKAYTEESLNAFVEQSKPDLLILSPRDYFLLADQGKLQDLDEWAGKAKMNLDDTIAPGVLAFLRSGNDDGKFYALSPFFRNEALYYNKDLFDSLGIPYPAEGITWAQTIELADRFMQDKRFGEDRKGFSFPWLDTAFDLMLEVAKTEGLSYADYARGAVTFDTPAWNAVFEQVVAAYRRGTFKVSLSQGEEKNGVVYFTPERMDNAEMFAAGKSAMTVDDSGLLMRLKSKTDFEWGIVPAPARASDPGTAGNLLINQMFAIPASSGQPKEAWQAISYFLSRDVGESKAGLGALAGWDLSVRADYPEFKQDDRFSVFYKTRPANALNLYAYGLSEGPLDFDRQFYELVNQHAKNAMLGKETTAKAVRAIQAEGDLLLKTLKMRQETDGGKPSASGSG